MIERKAIKSMRGDNRPRVAVVYMKGCVKPTGSSSKDNQTRTHKRAITGTRMNSAKVISLTANRKNRFSEKQRSSKITKGQKGKKLGGSSKIEWTQHTWNPVTGCTKISQGCKRCYAEKMTKRLQGLFPKYSNGFSVITTHPKELESSILTQAKPKIIFTCSMSDLFHKDVPKKFVLQVFEAMNRHDQHIYQVLTKRSERLQELSPKLPWADHIWMGVSVENEDTMYRIEHLRASSAHRKFLSLEPLLGPLPQLDLTGIDWVIVGGESGSDERIMNPEWVRPIRDNCIKHNVPFFFKQWGGFRKKENGRLLDGRVWDEMPRI